MKDTSQRNYHGQCEDEVREYLGISRTIYAQQRNARFGTKKWIAAAGLLVAFKEHHARWPEDAIAGMCGKVAPYTQPKLEVAA